MVAAAGPDVDTALRAALGQPLRRLSEPKMAAEARMADDRMTDPGNAVGNAPIAVDIDGLLAQSRQIERAMAAPSRGGIQTGGSDRLDDPDAVSRWDRGTDDD